MRIERFSNYVEISIDFADGISNEQLALYKKQLQKTLREREGRVLILFEGRTSGRKISELEEIMRGILSKVCTTIQYADMIYFVLVSKSDTLRNSLKNTRLTARFDENQKYKHLAFIQIDPNTNAREKLVNGVKQIAGLQWRNHLLSGQLKSLKVGIVLILVAIPFSISTFMSILRAFTEENSPVDWRYLLLFFIGFVLFVGSVELLIFIRVISGQNLYNQRVDEIDKYDTELKELIKNR